MNNSKKINRSHLFIIDGLIYWLSKRMSIGRLDLQSLLGTIFTHKERRKKIQTNYVNNSKKINRCSKKTNRSQLFITDGLID